MSLIKITEKKNQYLYLGIYSGETRNFSFDTQSSQPKIRVDLKTGDLIEIDTEASKLRILDIDGIYHFEGAFYNFYKNTQTNLLTICATLIEKRF